MSPEIEALITALDEIPPFPPAGAAWQASFLHHALIDMLRVATVEPASATSRILVQKATEYVEAVNRGREAIGL
jgi:hypothetical protein